MTNEEFIRRLKKARELALTKYESDWRIWEACFDCDIRWGHLGGGPTAKINTSTVLFLRDNGNTDENVRAVFDNSIKALGGKP
jgi:hypothetical protein